MEDFGAYVILTQPRLPHADIARICVARGVKMLQLREKHLDDRELLRIARELREITRGSATRLIINDRPDIAALCEADGLHLGQEDISLTDARRIVGSMPIGLSTHSLAQARAALEERPAYIGFGPVYATPTKVKPDPIVGCEALKEVLAFADVPVVAIGGLFPENLQPVLDAGARNVALVRYWMESEEFETRLEEIQRRLELRPRHG